MKRKVFFISDGTGITAQTLGHSLLTQFEDIKFNTTSIPYVDNIQKAIQTKNEINSIAQTSGEKPIIFATLVKPEIREIIQRCNATYLDFLQTFLQPLESALGTKSSYSIGRSHGMFDINSYNQRIEAVNFALAHDDGLKCNNYPESEIILIGVSRCGKTPTALYLALQFGTLVANYPFTEDDINETRLPAALRPFKSKLFGLTIDTERLAAIRSTRRANSKYASIEQCRIETQELEALYRRENIPFLNTTKFSIEEISTKILAITGLVQHRY